MLGDRLRAKFTHIPYHYGFMCSLHSDKVVKSGRHTRRIGVVGILYQNVAICLFQLRAVVFRNIFTHGLDCVFKGHSEMEAYSDGGGYVVGIVRTGQVSFEAQQVFGAFFRFDRLSD